MMKIGLFLLLSIIFYAQTPTPEPLQPGDTRTDEHGIEQVWVPAGCFLMGTTPEQNKVVRDTRPPAFIISELPSEQPQHEVCLTSGYWIDSTEVTNAAFQAFVDDGGYSEQSYWSEKGWAWLQTQDASQLP